MAWGGFRIISLALRHLLRHWRLNLTVLFGLTLAAALLSSLPSYTHAIAARSLHQTLENAPPAVRNIQIATPGGNLSAGLYGFIGEHIEEILSERVQVSETTIAAEPLDVDWEGNLLVEDFYLWSFSNLAHSVTVLEGKLPVNVSAKPNQLKPPVQQVAIGSKVAESTGLGIGDVVTSTHGPFGMQFEIVGIVEPIDLESETWWGSTVYFTVTKRAKNPNEDVLILPLFVSQDMLNTFIPDHQKSWRLLVDRQKITADNVRAVETDLIQLQTQIRTKNAQLTTGLPHILATYQNELSTSKLPLLLLTVQALAFVSYTLSLIASLLLSRSRGELAILASRGFSSRQITWVFALESLCLAVPTALLLGPLLSRAALRLWAEATGAILPSAVPDESRCLALAATAFGWLALVLPVYPATRRGLLEWQLQIARPAQRARWQRLHLDLFLLVFSALAYWQLSHSGSFVMRRLSYTRLADPLLLLGPSLLLIAVALSFLRVFPCLLRLAAWGCKRARGLILPLGLARLARDPLGPSRVVLLISLTAGLTLFASAFSHSLTVNQRRAAHYQAGADLRVDLVRTPEDSVTSLPGLLTISPVFRTRMQEIGKGLIPLLAIDPDTFDQVTGYPPGLTHLSIADITAVLQGDTAAGVLPAVLSYSALSPDKSIGDQLVYSLSGTPLTFEIRGLIVNFPTLSDEFIVTSLPKLAEQMGQTNPLAFKGPNELWLDVESARHTEIASAIASTGTIVEDAQYDLRVLQNSILGQGITSAFKLNALVLASLSLTGFLLIHYFMARQRAYEFSVLRATGLSARQLMTLLATESLIVMALGLLAGTGIGYGLVQLMRPYLSWALSVDAPVYQILIDWWAVARLYLALVLFYGAMTLLLLATLARVGIQRVLRLGEE